ITRHARANASRLRGREFFIVVAMARSPGGLPRLCLDQVLISLSGIGDKLRDLLVRIALVQGDYFFKERPRLLGAATCKLDRLVEFRLHNSLPLTILESFILKSFDVLVSNQRPGPFVETLLGSHLKVGPADPRHADILKVGET